MLVLKLWDLIQLASLSQLPHLLIAELDTAQQMGRERYAVQSKPCRDVGDQVRMKSDLERCAQLFQGKESLRAACIFAFRRSTPLMCSENGN